jgi:hypothetical protein
MKRGHVVVKRKGTSSKVLIFRVLAFRGSSATSKRKSLINADLVFRAPVFGAIRQQLKPLGGKLYAIYERYRLLKLPRASPVLRI